MGDNFSVFNLIICFIIGVIFIYFAGRAFGLGILQSLTQFLQTQKKKKEK